MVEIHHRRTPTLASFLGLNRVADPKDYVHVADVHVDELEEAFTLSQHLHATWTADPKVTLRPHGLEFVRSTSIGDVLVRDGRRYLVDILGFKPL